MNGLNGPTTAAIILQKFDEYRKRLISSPSANDRNFQSKLDVAFERTLEAVKQFDSSELCLSFNGGKDCTALLHLYFLAVVQTFGISEWTGKLNVIYFKHDNAFEELEEFIDRSKNYYHFDIIVLGGNIKAALRELKESHPNFKAILMGTRVADPNCHSLDHMVKTDPGWPEYWRISPIVHWTYADTWQFILGLEIPYCSLYDKGFTSIGDTTNSSPNPALMYEDETGQTIYKPAYLLEDESSERCARKTS